MSTLGNAQTHLKRRIYAVATFLDSRFKHHFATNPAVFLAKVSSWIKEDGGEEEINPK
jgi:hypothetical protein